MKGSIKCPWCDYESIRDYDKSKDMRWNKRLAPSYIMEDFIRHIKSEHMDIIKWEET